MRLHTVDMSKSFLVFSSTIDSDQPQYFQVGGEITNSTTLTFERTGNTGTVSISWQVFEFESGVTVQHGSNTNVARNTNVNVAINCIDLTKSFVLVTARKSGAAYGNDDGITANLTTSTNLQLFITGAAGANMEEVYWQVIEYQAATVKKVTATLAAGVASSTSTISPAVSDLTKAMVVSNHGQNGDVFSDDLPRTELTNTTTVTYSRVGTAQAFNFVAYVIEFTDQSTVTRGSQNFGSGSTSQNVAIAASASSGVIGSGNYGRQGSTTFATTDNLGHNWFTYEITSAVNLQINRAVGTGFTAIAPWQIVTFEDTGLQQNTFYSFASGAWESNSSWSFTPDGSSGAVPTGVYPRRNNNVVIQNSHTITVNSVTDNNPCSQSPNGLSLGNVGPFTGSGDQMFYHTGDILIANGGTLTATEEMMLEGYTLVQNGGTFSIFEDIVNLGYLEISTTATFTNTDDLILSGNSTTIINSLAFGADDIYIDWTNATLCGDGIMNLGNGGPDPTVQFFNGGTLAQICSTFDLTCTSNCGAFPITPTGNFSVGNTGPGGVATTDGTSELKVWLDASESVFSNAGVTPSTDGGIVQQWSDLSGSGNNATKTGFEPTFDLVDPTINNAAAIDFTAAGSNRFNLNTFTLNPFSSSFSIISVLNSGPTTGANQNVIQQKDVSGTGRTLLLYDNTAAKLTTFLGGVSTAPAATYTLSTWTISSQTFNFNGATTSINLFKAGTSDGAATVTPETTVGSWLIGSNKGETGAFFNGSMGELLILNQSINNAKRIIIENYLSAKYNIALTGNDIYAMDNVVNGNYDYEVAGVGQASDGTNHKDAKGTGIVRMWNPNGLANSEFLLWGHDNTAITSTTSAIGTAVDGTIIEERLSRIWRVGEVGDVGNVSISFDFNGIGSPLGSNLRLLIDRDGDGFADNDITPIVGSVSGGIAIFSNINFQNGDRFTLGNTDASVPLPIELLSFNAGAEKAGVKVTWSTASELNNDFFTVQRSQDAEQWQNVIKVKGSGNSNERIDYETTDGLPFTGVSYYRLKQTDLDGQYSYSSVKRVEMDKGFDLKVYPNPSSGRFTISTGFELQPENIKLYNSIGQQMSVELDYKNGSTILESNLSKGIYILKVSHGYWRQSVRVVIE
ncbi:MAG: T9SS type A sorting domain-containing protein [Cytophagales bacterium]|nr:T9SS type A sorting domain-containing protein [Cytophagales bacterium]